MSFALSPEGELKLFVYMVMPLAPRVRDTLSSHGMNIGGDCRQNNQSEQYCTQNFNSVALGK